MSDTTTQTTLASKAATENTTQPSAPVRSRSPRSQQSQPSSTPPAPNAPAQPSAGRTRTPRAVSRAENHGELLFQLKALNASEFEALLCDPELALSALPDRHRHYIAEAMNVEHLFTFQRRDDGNHRIDCPKLPESASMLLQGVSRYAAQYQRLAQIQASSGLELSARIKQLLDPEYVKTLMSMTLPPIEAFNMAAREAQREVGNRRDQQESRRTLNQKLRGEIASQAQDLVTIFGGTVPTADEQPVPVPVPVEVPAETPVPDSPVPETETHGSGRGKKNRAEPDQPAPLPDAETSSGEII